MTERATGEETGAAIRVVLVDDHTMLRHGVREALIAGGLDVVGEASNGRAGAQLVGELRPDVVVMDVDMPQLNGIEATTRIVASDPGARVLMLTISTEDRHVVDALAAGACGYVLKTAAPEEIVRAVESAYAGESAISPRIATRLVDRVRDNAGASATPPPLTPRELEILKLIAEGRENNEIAEALFISPSTAKNHVASVLEKLGASNRVQAAVYAVRSGLV
jgi:DNA-binding NarL/FixJ family response regulator